MFCGISSDILTTDNIQFCLPSQFPFVHKLQLSELAVVSSILVFYVFLCCPPSKILSFSRISERSISDSLFLAALIICVWLVMEDLGNKNGQVN